MTIAIARINGVKTQLGEGPVWDVGERAGSRPFARLTN